MYIPAHFAETDRARLVELMRAHNFATLVTAGDGGAPLANHLPFLVDDGDALVLLAHMARANPQWKQLDREALVIFHGPHTYISPSLYRHGSPAANVPTWNYAAVHAYGRPRLLDDAATAALVARLTAQHEAGRAEPWTADMTTSERQAMVTRIVGFAIEVTRLEGKLKLSQNRATGDREQVAAAMAAGAHPDELELAALMARR